MAKRQLFINLKQQDRLREWFSKRGNVYDTNLITNNISFGDSDVNYELDTDSDFEKIQILPAPYQAPHIRWRLTFSGDYAGLQGTINAYKRILFEDGSIFSRYATGVKESREVPDVINNSDTTDLVFGTDPTLITPTTYTGAMGYIVFLETIPTGYVDSFGNPLRLPETYTITPGKNFPEPLTSTLIKKAPVPHPIGGATGITTVSPHGLKEGDIVYVESSTLGGLNKIMVVHPYTYSGYGFDPQHSFSLTDLNGNVFWSDNDGYITIRKWILTQDFKNGSFILAKGAFQTEEQANSNTHFIDITGNTSGLTKRIYFNI